MKPCTYCSGQHDPSGCEVIRRTLRQAQQVLGYQKLYARSLGERDIGELSFESLPLLSAADIARDPWDFCAVPRRDVARIYTTSGTTGISKVLFMSKHDVDLFVGNVADLLAVGEVGAGSILVPILSYGPTAGSIEVALAGMKKGATVVPVSIYTPEQLFAISRALAPTHIITLPSVLYSLSAYARENNTTSAVPRLLVGGEVLTESGRKLLKEQWHATEVYELYGSMEIFGVAARKPGCIGFHRLQGYHAIEFLDWQTHQPSEPGRVSEVAVTTYRRQAMPLIRYRMGDLAVVLDDQCPCGASDPPFLVLGRADESLICGGAFVLPHELRFACDYAAHQLGAVLRRASIKISRDTQERDALSILLAHSGSAREERLVSVWYEGLAKCNADFKQALRSGAVVVSGHAVVDETTRKLRVEVSDTRHDEVIREARAHASVRRDLSGTLR